MCIWERGVGVHILGRVWLIPPGSGRFMAMGMGGLGGEIASLPGVYLLDGLTKLRFFLSLYGILLIQSNPL